MRNLPTFPNHPPMSQAEERFFAEELALHEAKYLAGSNPRQQSGFDRDEADWERYRRPVVAAIESDGSFLDIGCANGLLMESVVRWAGEEGHVLEPYGLDISEKLVQLARGRLPAWHDRIFAGNALYWEPPMRFDFVRTELGYVPPASRRRYAERLLKRFLLPDGRLIICSYGSSRPEGGRADLLVDEIRDWGHSILRVDDAVSPEYDFVVARAVTLVGSSSAG